MSVTDGACEKVQFALLERQDADWVAAHLESCDECRFVAELSRECRVGAPLLPADEASSVGGALEALLGHAQQNGQAVLSRYRLLERLGRGGQGIVHRALNVDTGETVALKLTRLTAQPYEVVHAHLVRHPNVCRVYHTEPHGALRLIEMEFVDAPSLAAVGDSLDERAKLRLFRGVCAAVQAAHEVGVLHLDLKPSNILVHASGEPVVTDFGLSVRIVESEPTAARGGTHRYMAPEQRDGRPVDRRTDVYALGTILAELLPRPPRRCKRLIERATAANPERRFSDVPSLLHALDRPAQLRVWAGRFAAGLAPLFLLGLGLGPWRWGRPAKPDVFVVGGLGADGLWTASAEVFDASRWRWRSVERMPDPGRGEPRTCAMRAVRSGDDVLVLGGGAASSCWVEWATTNRVRAYSLANGTWSAAECQAPCIEHDGATYRLDVEERDQRRRWKKGDCRPQGPCMLFGRHGFLTLPLADDVFVFGGSGTPNELEQFHHRPVPMFRTAELYRHSTRTFSPAPASRLSRPNSGGVGLGGGSVLVCGGYDDSTDDAYDQHDTCELFNRTEGDGVWRAAGRMPAAAHLGTMKLAALRDNLVIGVQQGHAWLWRMKDWWRDPDGWRWDGGFFEPVPVPMDDPQGATLTRLRDGRALLAGGSNGGRVVPTVKLFTLGPGDKGGSWSTAAPMKEARRDHAVVTLEDGRIMVVGGCGPRPLSTAEVYDPVRDRWTDAGRMSVARCVPEAVATW